MKEKAKIERSNLEKDKATKTPPEEDDESIASLLKIIHTDIKVMKSDLKVNNQQISTINSKITAIKNDNARTEGESKLAFQAIRYYMGRIETAVTSKVINELDPKMSSLRTELREDLNTDLRRLVQEV